MTLEVDLKDNNYSGHIVYIAILLIVVICITGYYCLRCNKGVVCEPYTNKRKSSGKHVTWAEDLVSIKVIPNRDSINNV
jgi:hypothetical protein